MSQKISDKTIQKIREMRKTHTELQVATACNVSMFTVNRYCKDMGINFRKNPIKPAETSTLVKPVIKCDTYSFNELSDEDKKRYLECKPLNREAEQKTYITAKKSNYSTANVSECHGSRGLESVEKAFV